MATPIAGNPFSDARYTVRRDIFNVWNRKFRISNAQEQPVLYSEMKAMKLKEDIRVYADEGKTREVLVIKARQILDISATYDVWDSQSQNKVGALRRKGLKSLVRDEWSMLDANDQVIGKIQEDSLVLALLRRFLTNLIPQSYSVTLNEQELAEFKQNFNPFLLKLTLDFSRDPQGQLDRRLGIAAAILLCAIEGRQQQY
jgi:uncharacterized protein YxjI